LVDAPSLGRRGGGWVVLQFPLMAAVLAAGVWGPRWPDGLRVPLAVAGAAVAAAGVALVVAAARELGGAFTPFPKPPREARLAVAGPYRVVRHPVYAGGILVFAGLSLALSPLALAPAGLLAVLFALKLRVEERFLREAFPEYAAYSARTRFRLVPFLY
jgi:protein-S-isoprenylcysteine O-methyltransferase Ste14